MCDIRIRITNGIQMNSRLTSRFFQLARICHLMVTLTEISARMPNLTPHTDIIAQRKTFNHAYMYTMISHN